ncbi:hypothetical protein [Reyranella sp.]
MHDALPDGLAFEKLFDRQRVDQHGLASMLALDGLSELIGTHFH